MAYTPHPSVSTGDSYSAAQWNMYIRDNMAAGVPDLFTAKGDIAVATGDNAAIALPVGATKYVLTAASAETAGVRWCSLGAAQNYSNSNWLIAIGAWEKVGYTETRFDPDGLIVNSKFTARHQGYYLVHASVSLTTGNYFNEDEVLQLGLYKGGALYSILDTIVGQSLAAGIGTYVLQGWDILNLTEGQYIEIYVYQDAVAYATKVSSPSTTFSVAVII